MFIRRAIVFVLWVFCLGPASGFAAIDCGPVKPGPTTDTSIEDNLKGHAQIILKSLGSGDIESGYKQTEADTLNKYPNADQLVLWRSYIYLVHLAGNQDPFRAPVHATSALPSMVQRNGLAMVALK
jgi:hypothetical protein